MTVDRPILGLSKEALVWDNHACMPLRPNDTSFLTQLSRLKKMSVDVVGLNIGMDMSPWQDVVQMASSLRQWIAEHSDDYMIVGNALEISEAKACGKLGVFFDLEGGKPLNNKIHMVQEYYDLGVRWMLMAYNQNNELSGGCHDNDKGLTSFGQDVLTEMNRVGMIPCCSHMGERSALELCERSTSPVILSHSNPRAVWDHSRNVTNKVLKSCAATGGVVGLNGIGIFLGDNDNSTETFVSHIDYLVQLIGVAHVGFGLDYVFDQKELDDWIVDNRSSFPKGSGYDTGMKMVEPERLPDIAESLLNKGYNEDSLTAIFGGNFHRLAIQVWK